MNPGLVEGIDRLAVDVELQLRRRGVPDAHGRGSGEAREPAELALFEPTLTGEAVHDLDVGRVAGHRPEQPLAPGTCLVAVARMEHRQQRERRVAEPAVPIVPVPDASELLREARSSGAATIPPVGAYVSAFSRSSDWWISSW